MGVILVRYYSRDELKTKIVKTAKRFLDPPLRLKVDVVMISRALPPEIFMQPCQCFVLRTSSFVTETWSRIQHCDIDCVVRVDRAIPKRLDEPHD